MTLPGTRRNPGSRPGELIPRPGINFPEKTEGMRITIRRMYKSQIVISGFSVLGRLKVSMHETYGVGTETLRATDCKQRRAIPSTER